MEPKTIGFLEKQVTLEKQGFLGTLMIQDTSKSLELLKSLGT